MPLPDPKPRSLVRFHFVAMIIWALLAIPTVLIWRESILWVAFMSLYANFVGHFSGWDGARAEQSAREDKGEERQEESLDGPRTTLAT
jgi:hypothetical protein